MNDIALFHIASIETSSLCNRACDTCGRNSYPDKRRISPWYKQHLLPIDVIFEIRNQLRDMGFVGSICLSHYNEPLLDYRLDEIIGIFKSSNCFKEVYFHTNGDYMTPEWAEELDGLVDRIVVSLYMNEPMKSERKEWIKSLFKKTNLQIINGLHVTSHYSPRDDLESKISSRLPTDCKFPLPNMIINHRGQYLLCCEDIVGEFELGTFPQTSIEDYWYGDKHIEIVNTLIGSRRKNYPHCTICPR